MTGVHVPWTRPLSAGSFSNFWVRVSGGPLFWILRAHAYLPLPEALDLGTKARRFSFEVEILVQAKEKAYRLLKRRCVLTIIPTEKEFLIFVPSWIFWRNSSTFTRLIFTRILFSALSQQRSSFSLRLFVLPEPGKYVFIKSVPKIIKQTN